MVQAESRINPRPSTRSMARRKTIRSYKPTGLPGHRLGNRVQLLLHPALELASHCEGGQVDERRRKVERVVPIDAGSAGLLGEGPVALTRADQELARRTQTASPAVGMAGWSVECDNVLLEDRAIAELHAAPCAGSERRPVDHLRCCDPRDRAARSEQLHVRLTRAREVENRLAWPRNLDRRRRADLNCRLLRGPHDDRTASRAMLARSCPPRYRSDVLQTTHRSSTSTSACAG